VTLIFVERRSGSNHDDARNDSGIDSRLSTYCGIGKQQLVCEELWFRIRALVSRSKVRVGEVLL